MTRRCLWVCLVLASAVAGTQAQALPKVTNLSRDWFQRGSTNDLVVTGEHLERATALLSSASGVDFEIVPSPAEDPIRVESTRGGVSVVPMDEGKSLRVRVRVLPSAVLAPGEVRVVTPTGVSNPVRFATSAMPEVLEERDGNEPQKLQLPVGVSGVISNPGERDRYRFDAQRGQELIVEILAFRVGSPLDSSLAIVDGAGKELARSEDAKGFDSFLHFKVPENGEYTVELRDFRYGGSPKHKYHLTLGALPYVDSVFPAGGRRGEPVEVALRGSSLGNTERLLLHLDAAAPLGAQELRVTTTNGLSLPFPFQVGDLAEASETEPNDATNQANVVVVPLTINGRIGRVKDIDTFRFKTTAAGPLVCEVVAQRFGSPLDALLTLRNISGEVLQRNDDAVGADAKIEFSANKDTEYLLSLQDLLGRGGPEFVYRISIRPPQPDFEVRVKPDAARLFCGGRAVLQCQLLRKSGFDGAVRMEAMDLPPGIHADPLLMKPEESLTGLFVLSADNDAKGGTFPLRITATAMLNGQPITRKAAFMLGDSPVRESLVTVMDTPAPFVLELGALSVLLDQEQSAVLKVRGKRRSDFEGEIKLALEGYAYGRDNLTEQIESPEVILKAGESDASLQVKARAYAEPGSRPVYVKAETTVDRQSVVQYSDPIPLTIRQIPFTLLNTMKNLSVTVLPPGRTSAAAEAEFAVRTERRGWFAGEISLALEGLPEGITATSTNLPSGIGEAGFKLTATDKAPAGKEFKIVVRGTATIGGRTYEQRTTPATLTVSKAPEMAESKRE
jgi:hypothetical protein